MREYGKRGLARAVAALLLDGRPHGCTCPPNPGSECLPSDNKHIGSLGCPYTAIEKGWPGGYPPVPKGPSGISARSGKPS